MILFEIIGALAALMLALALAIDWRFACYLAGFFAGLAAMVAGAAGAMLAGVPSFALLALMPGLSIVIACGRAMERRAGDCH